MKKSSLLAAASAFAVISGFAAVPALASALTCDNCNVAWNFDPGIIDIDAAPIFLDLDSLTRICANQTFAGEQSDLAAIGHVSALDVSNTASAIANVVSVSGGKGTADETLPSSFPAVVNAIQKANGELTAVAAAYDVKAWHGDFENIATAAANIINVSSTDVGVISGSQTAGNIGLFSRPLELETAAVASNVFAKTGNLDNTASSVANVASVSVSGDGLKNGFFDPTKDVVALVDLDQSAFTDQSSFAMLTKAYGKGDVSNAASSVVNAVSATVETPAIKTGGFFPAKSVGTVAIDVNQTAFSNLSAVSIAGKVASGGNFTNAATTAANVINVINK